MTKQGVLDRYTRSEEETFVFDEEAALARVALVLADVLESRGVTQKELAERVGVSESRISQILSADSNPTVRTLARIGSALGCCFNPGFEAPPLVARNAQPWPYETVLRGPWQPSAPARVSTPSPGAAVSDEIANDLAA